MAESESEYELAVRRWESPARWKSIVSVAGILLVWVLEIQIGWLIGFAVGIGLLLAAFPVKWYSNRATGWWTLVRSDVRDLIQRVNEADVVASTGDHVAATEMLDAAAAVPAAGTPLVAAMVATLRGGIAGAQEDLETAESELRRAVAQHEKGRNRPALTEVLERLGGVQIRRGHHADARRSLLRALQVAGPGKIYRQSGIQIGLHLAGISLHDEDIPGAIGYAMAARRLASAWQSPAQRGTACDLLAAIAIAEDRLADAESFLREAGAAARRDDLTLSLQLRHTAVQTDLALARGDRRAALRLYLKTMRLVAELKAGWGWRNVQAHMVGRYHEEETAAFTLAYALHLDGDATGFKGFAALLDLGNRTALRDILRGEFGTAASGNDNDADSRGIADLLKAIALREQAAAGGEARDVAWQQAVEASYERLEGLVSLRFRRILEAQVQPPRVDVPDLASRWNANVLQSRFVMYGEAGYIAGMWTRPDRRQTPFLHPLDGRQLQTVRELSGLVDSAPDTDPQSEAGRPDEEAEGQRGSDDWRQTRRFRHLAGRDKDVWTAAAGILLPEELIAVLRTTDPDGEVPKLLLVPDSVLWRIPWGALVVDPQQAEGYLADRTVLAMLPSLSLIDDRADAGSPPGTVAYLAGVNADGLDIERQALDAAYGPAVSYPTEGAGLVSALADGGTPLGLAVVSVHGDRRPGLAHVLRLDARTELSAAQMLTLHFPRVLMINACLSAELDERHGTDPLGIPTVALCRGAETVIGGMYPLPDGHAGNPRYSHPTARILAPLYALLAEGVPPSTALRAAQRSWRKEHAGCPPWLWAGLVSITTRFDDSAHDPLAPGVSPELGVA